MDNTNNNKNNSATENQQSPKKKKQLSKGAIIAIVLGVLAVGGVSTYLVLDKQSDGDVQNEESQLDLNVHGGHDGVDTLNPNLEGHEDVGFDIGSCTAISNPNIGTPCEDIASFKDAVEEYMNKANSSESQSNNPTFAIPSICVKFSLGSAVIQQNGLIETFAEYYLKTNKKAVILIEGYTCDLGDDSSNMNLSKNRANSAKQILVNLGVPEDRIEMKWYGESQYSKLGYSAKEDHRRVNISIK